MKSDLPLLGICQGAQMIAHHCGAHVGPHPEGWHEFGYYEVTPTDPTAGFMDRAMHMPQAHFHGFDIPAGGEGLARSALFPHQAFRMGPRVYGVQFHPEQTMTGFRRWQDDPSRQHGPGIQTRDEQNRLMQLHHAAQGAWFDAFLTRLFGV